MILKRLRLRSNLNKRFLESLTFGWANDYSAYGQIVRIYKPSVISTRKLSLCASKWKRFWEMQLRIGLFTYGDQWKEYQYLPQMVKTMYNKCKAKAQLEKPKLNQRWRSIPNSFVPVAQNDCSDAKSLRETNI